MVFKNPEIFGFTSWLTFGFDEIDFGWGKPIWVGLRGEGGSGRNLIVLQNTTSGNGIEAWVTLYENIMSILEQDPEFLAFATLRSSVLIQWGYTFDNTHLRTGNIVSTLLHMYSNQTNKASELY